mmetsp:Transcript_42865/g.93118  ORF Transcript_42865/g.93118 Transcript_42865/m.93118 type:complete len:97 (+) Transcript_42865:130-420(+)
MEMVCSWMVQEPQLEGEEKERFHKEFLEKIDLFEVVKAANYLDIKPLLDFTCKAVAEQIKACETPEAVRARFGIVNDFTPEEEEAVRRENAWVDEV